MEFLEGSLVKLISNILQSSASRTITNIAEKEYNSCGKLKKILLQVYIKDFVHRYRRVF